jgi:putative thioredoxin
VAASALAGVRLFRRAEQLDPVATRAAADAAPDDLDAQFAAADVDMIAGNAAQAFARLVDLVVRTSGAERDRARVHLLGLFEAAGPEEPALGPARAALSRALF